LKRFKDEVDPDLVQVYGTKLASTVHYIQKLLLPKKEGEESARILVFSQFNNFLHKFGYLLGMNARSFVQFLLFTLSCNLFSCKNDYIYLFI
jgi:hypothetical protein